MLTRNVQFRVWSKQSGEMWPVKELYWNADGKLHVADMPAFVHADDDILMQSTGLKDVSGKDIFECDIVKFETFDAVDVVIYEPPTFKTRNHSLQGYECKVIGNIYENPERLL